MAKLSRLTREKEERRSIARAFASLPFWTHMYMGSSGTGRIETSASVLAAIPAAELEERGEVGGQASGREARRGTRGGITHYFHAGLSLLCHWM